MEGQRVSHYDVLERLGGGGMGVVHRALDARLDRHVALKFLPPELTRDEEARQRFVQEARAASALDHPNICTIHEIDSTPDGRLFIAMALYDGETLKRRIDRGPLPIDEAVDIAEQIARGLAKAHAAGIVHRDVKPANAMITRDGFVKILDFGIAKLLGVTGPTRTGSTLGTVAYMSPEQVNGEDVDQRSDVWALGAVLYEMLTGRPPFAAESELAIIAAIATREPTPPRSLRPEIPPALEEVVLGALTKSVEARIPSAEAFRGRLEACRPQPVAKPARRRATAGGRRAAAAAVTLVVAAGVFFLVRGLTGGDRAWVFEAAVPEIERLARERFYDSAWVVARRAQDIAPDEPALAELWPQFSFLLPQLNTDPPGAQVFRRPYGARDDAAWEPLGTTPLRDFRIPYSPTELRIALAGYAPTHLVPLGIDEMLAGLPLLTLDASDGAPAGMVRVSAWTVSIDGEDARLGDFFIDRLEVTNREYKAFVDAGGYSDPQYWEHPFVRNGRTLGFAEAMALFTDETGRPGPSTWQVGTYPEGQDDHPVGGVSWYEAAAYAKFAGKSLPSVYHWRRAYGTIYFMESLIPRSNFGGDGAAPVGSFAGMGPFGTFDMAGNVREWAHNAVGDDRFVLGGGWNDPDYVGINSLNIDYTQPSLDRSPTNGIRLVTYLERGPDLERALAPRQRTAPPDYRAIASRPTDDVFEIYGRLYAYDPAPLDAVVEESRPARQWVREKISFDAAYGDERVVLYLYLPTSGSPPYQTLVFWPGVIATSLTSIEQSPAVQADFVVQSGRALAFPILKGTFERNDGFTAPPTSAAFRDRTIEQVQDVMRTVDYLKARDDIDAERLGYYGFSWGGSRAPIVLALEPRFRVAVLDVAGISNYTPLPEVDPVTYLTRVTLPTLMVNGRLDAVFPLETSARPYFDLLGTPREHKRFVISEGGHAVPRPQLIREALDWLDRYLGPVTPR